MAGTSVLNGGYRYVCHLSIQYKGERVWGNTCKLPLFGQPFTTRAVSPVLSYTLFDVHRTFLERGTLTKFHFLRAYQGLN